MEIKKIYQINLTPRRITILSGAFVILISMFFFIGYTMGQGNEEATLPAVSNPEPQMSEFEKVLKNDLSEIQMENSVDNAPQPDEVYSPDSLKSRDTSKETQKKIPKETLQAKKTTTPPATAIQDTAPEEKKNHSPVKNKKRSTSVSEAANKQYFLQVAAYVHEKDALKLKAKLKKNGIKTMVVRGSRFWFVRSEKANEKNSLLSMQGKLEKMNFQPVILFN